MDAFPWLALANIVALDLVLSGDNAVVIGMAVRRLPPHLARRAAIIGASVAVGLRVAFTAAAAVLMHVPLLQALGGVVLFWVAYKLLKGEDEAAAEGHGAVVAGFWPAIGMIAAADVVMSLDNVLAVGGAAHGDLRLLAFGLALSIPIVLLGSGLVGGALRRWPALSWLGAGVVAATACKMILDDGMVQGWLAAGLV